MHLPRVLTFCVLVLSNVWCASPPSQASKISTENGMTILEDFPLLVKRQPVPDDTCDDKGGGNNITYIRTENGTDLGTGCFDVSCNSNEAVRHSSSKGRQPSSLMHRIPSASGTSVMSTTMVVNTTSVVSASAPTTSPSNSQAPLQDPTRCGYEFNRASCAPDLCCSWKGYCGGGPSYCSVPENCQVKYGTCDSELWPQGHRTSLDIRYPVKDATIITRCTKPNTVALTYDDGPGQYTDKLLDLLQNHNAKATFFVSGNTKGTGELDTTAFRARAVRRMIKEGHQVGSHGWAHIRYDSASIAQQQQDLVKNEMAIRNTVGGYPAYFRPPYDSCSKQSGCLNTVSQMGYHVVAFEYDSDDWMSDFNITGASARARDIFNQLHPDNDSALFIMHDINQISATHYTAYLLDLVSSKGMKAVTLGECIEVDSQEWYHKSFKNDRIGEQPQEAELIMDATSNAGPTMDSWCLDVLRLVLRFFMRKL